jgi:hypothetical protein
MSLTVTQCEITLNRRWGECAALADTQDALFRSADLIPLTLTTIGVVVDADLVQVTAAQYPQLMDVAEERGLATILANLDKTNLTAIGVYTDPEKLRLKYQALLDRMRKYIKDTYGIGLPTISVGVIDMNFQEQFDPTSPWGIV